MTNSRFINCSKAFPEDSEVLDNFDGCAVDFYIEEQNEKVVPSGEKSIEDTIDEETMDWTVAEKFTVARAMEVMSEKLTADEFLEEYDDDPDIAVE